MECEKNKIKNTGPTQYATTAVYGCCTASAPDLQNLLDKTKISLRTAQDFVLRKIPRKYFWRDKKEEAHIQHPSVINHRWCCAAGAVADDDDDTAPQRD